MPIIHQTINSIGHRNTIFISEPINLVEHGNYKLNRWKDSKALAVNSFVSNNYEKVPTSCLIMPIISMDSKMSLLGGLNNFAHQLKNTDKQ